MRERIPSQSDNFPPSAVLGSVILAVRNRTVNVFDFDAFVIVEFVVRARG